MRVMLWTAESTCNWLAWISSGDWAPLLAAWTTRLLMFSSRLATSLRAPSVVLMTLLARLELSIAWWMPVISLRRASLAMSPAGSSAPRLIRRPLLSRWRVPFSVCCDLASPRWAVSAATFVLMRAIQSSVIAHGEPEIGFRFRISDFGFRISDCGFRIAAFGLRKGPADHAG